MIPFFGGVKLFTKSWLSPLVRIWQPRRRRERRQPSRLLLERLEDRTLLTVTPSVTGNTVTFYSDAGDTVYLNSTNGILSYNSDGSGTYTSLGVNLTAAANSISSNTVIVIAGNLFTDGRDLSIEANSGIEVNANVIVSTRDIAAPFTGNHQTAPSTGNSGTLTFDVQNASPFDPIPFVISTSPHITVNANAQLLAQASGFTAGDISLTATNRNLSVDLLIYNDLGVVVRDATITVNSATINGGNVTIQATGGDIALVDQMNQTLSADAASWVQGLVQTATGPLSALTSLPFSFMVKIGTANVTLGNGSRLTASGDVQLSSEASADATGEAVYYRGTQFGASFGFNWAETSAKTTVGENVTISSQGSVTIESNAENNINGTARVTQNIGGGPSTVTNLSNVEISGVVGVSELTSHATVAQNANITAGTGVMVDAEGTYANVLSVQTASYYSGRAGLTFFVGYSRSDVLAEVLGNITVTNAGPTVAPAIFNPFQDVNFATDTIRFGDTSNLHTGDRIRYSSGIGASIPGLQDDTYYYVIVAGPQHIKLAATAADARAGTAIDFGTFPTLTRTNGTPITLPITDIDESTNRIDYQYPTGLANGDTVTYTAVPGQNIGGLSSGTYTIANLDTNTNSFQLRDGSNNIVVFNLSPKMTINGLDYDFNVNPYDATITFINPPGALPANGAAMTFKSALGRTIQGLNNGQTYYAITNPYATSVVRLANSKIEADLAYQEGLAAYTQANTGAYDSDNAPDWFNAGTGSARMYPYLTTAAGIPLAIAKIDPATNSIVFAVPLTGIVDGQVLTYTAVAGLNIQGLTNGSQYKADFDSGNPTILKLTDLADAPIDLDSSPEIVRQSNNAVIEFSVNSSGQLVLVNPPGDLVNGEAVTYRQAFLVMNAAQTDGTGGIYTGLTDNVTYYVVLTGTPGVVLLAKSAAQAQAAAAGIAANNNAIVMANTIQGIAFTGIDGSTPILVNLQVGGPLMSGTAHMLTPDSSGITIQANLLAGDTGATSTLAGFTPTFYDALTKGEVLNTFGSILQNFRDLSPNGTDTVEDRIINNLPDGANGGHVTGGPDWSATGSFGVQDISNTVKAHVGGAAVLNSNQNISITSTITETAQIAAESAVYQPDSADNNKSFAAAVVVGVYSNNVQTVIDNGANLQAAGAFSASSTLTYPFVFPLKNDASAAAFFEQNPIQNIAGFFDGELGLDTLLFNSWVRSVAEGSNDSVGIGGSVAVLDYQNTSKTTIGAATIAAQSVSVDASTAMEFNYMAGVFDIFLTPEAIIDYARNGNKLAFYNPFGTDDAVGGVGGTVMVVVADNTTEASIGAAHITVQDQVTVTAENKLLQISLAQSGARAKNFGFAGTITVLDVTNNTTAQVGPGAAITAASLDVDATDSTVMVNLAGSVEKANHIGFGVTVTVNKLDRDTEAIVGADHGQTAASSSSITLGGDATINAENSGALVAASFAAAIKQAPDDDQQDGANGTSADIPLQDASDWSRENPIPNMNDDEDDLGVGNGNQNAGKYGVAVSGDAAVTLIKKDNAYAFINDKQPTAANTFNLTAGNISITASNTTSIGSFAGAVAAATGSDASTNIGLSGSFTWNTFESDTEAYIANAALQAAALLLDAKRTGQLVSITAGCAIATEDGGVGISGSVSVSDVTHKVASYLQNVKATLTGDTTITAEDETRIITVAGGVGYGGKAGMGVAVAVNLLTNTTQAYIAGSTLNSSRAVSVVAQNDNPTSDARIVALTGTVGFNTSNTGVTGAGMVSVNIITNSTQAYISGSTITLTAADDVTINAIDKSWIISVGFAAGGGSRVGVGFAFGFNKFNDQSESNNDVPAVTTYIDDSSITTGGELTVAAENRPVIGAASLSGEGAKSLTLAGNASINVIETTTDAHISNSPGTAARINVTGAIKVDAQDNSEIVSIAGNVAISTNQFAFGAAFSFNLVSNKITAWIDDSAVTSGSTLDVTATSAPLLVAVAVSGDGGKNYAAGGAITVNRITNTADAHISGKSTVTANGALTVSASDSSAMYVVAIGISIAGTAEGGAGVAANAIGDISNANKRNVISAYIDDSTVSSTTGKVTVAAGFDDVGAVGQTSTTLGNGMGENGNEPLAFAWPANMSTPQTVTTPAGTPVKIFNLSIGGGGAQNFGFGGALSLNYLRNDVEARISGNAHVTAGTTVVVEAGDTSKITSIAGAATLVVRGGQSGIGVSFGISVGINDISNNISASVDDSTAHGAQGVTLTAETAPSILAVTVAGAGSGTTQGGGIAIAGAGAGSGNTIDNTVTALIENGSTVSSGAGYAVQIAAADQSKITAGSGVLAVGVAQNVTIDIGAAAAVNKITNNITASINASTVTAGGAVDITATSGVTIFALTIGIAGGISIGDSGGVDLTGAGSGSGNSVGGTIEASIKNVNNGRTVTSGTGFDISLQALDTNTKITAGAGAAAVALGTPNVAVAIGVSVAVNKTTNTFIAQIENSTVNSGRNVELSAKSTADILSVAVAGGVTVGISEEGSVAFAGAGAGTKNTIDNHITAEITDHSTITVGTGGSVQLDANDQSTITADGGGVTVGISGGGGTSVAGAIGAGVAVNDISNIVKSGIDASTVTAPAVSLSATEAASITAVTWGVAGSIAASGEFSVAVAGAGASSYNDIDNTVQAYIQNGAKVTATGAVSLTATDSATIDARAGGGALAVSVSEFGGTATVAAVVAHNDVSNTVEAYIGLAGTNPDTTEVKAATVEVEASSSGDLKALGVAVSFSAAITLGLAVSGGGGDAKNTTSSTIAAFVQNGSTVETTGSVTISAKDNVQIKATMGTGDLGFSVVGIGIGASTTENTIGDSVKAYIDAATVTSVTGDVAVTATSTTTITSLSVAVSISSGAAGNGTDAKATDNIAVAAYISGAAQVTASGGAINVTASSNPKVSASAPGGVDGVLVIGVMLATAELNGSTKAYIGEGASVSAQAIDISATASNLPGSDAVTASVVYVDISAITGTGVNSKAIVGHVVESYIGPEAGATPTNAATTITATSGSAAVSGSSTLTAQSSANGGTGGGVDITAIIITADLIGSTSAYVGGNTTLNAGDVEVGASGTSTASASGLFVGIGSLGGNGANVKATENHTVSSYISSGANLSASGNINIEANSVKTATIDSTGGSGSFIVNIEVLLATATVSGDTYAYVAQGATVHANQLLLAAVADERTATATTEIVGVSLVGSGNGGNTQAIIDGDVEAYVGPQAGGTSTGATTTLVITGAVTVEAEASADSATAASTGGAGSVVLTVDILHTSATISGNTRAYVGPGTIVEAGQIAVTANADSRVATTTAEVIGISILGGGASSETNATVSGTVEAFIGRQDGSNTAGATTLDISGTVTVAANSTADVVVTLKVGAGGAVAVASADSDAVIDETTRAYISPGVTIGSANGPASGLAVTATAIDAASNTATVGSGGGIAGRGTDTEAHVTANVLTWIDNNVTVYVTGDVNIAAESTRAEAHATGKSYGGGAVDVGIPEADAFATPNVTSYIGSQSIINAGGDVSVTAYALSTPSSTQYTDFIQSVNVPNGEIVFPRHGLQTGDEVAYEPGTSPIQTPSGPLQNGIASPNRIYKVIVVDANTLQLGSVFSAGGINAVDPQSTGAGFVNVEGVDAQRNIIRFFAPHYFETGDAVIYANPNDSSTNIGNLTPGQTYYIRKIDANTIKLYNTLAETADSNFYSFSPATEISGSTFNSNPLGLTNGAAVTYQSPAPTLFQNTAVNAAYDQNPNTNDTNYIYVGENHGYNTGDRIVYEANGGTQIPNPIIGLTPSATYYVVRRDNYTIQLAASQADATHDPPTILPIEPNTTTPNANLVNNLLVRPAIGGLTNNMTYYVVGVPANGSSFQLAATPGGTPINLDVSIGSGIGGLHTIGRDGIKLTPGSGVQNFRIAFTSASTSNPTDDKLFGPGGVSLRQLNPPVGTGQSSAVADGGSGGFVEVDEPSATTTVAPTVTAWVAAQLINAGGSVLINAITIANSAASADNSGGGFIEVGDAESTSNFNNSVSAYIGVNNGSSIDGSGVQIIAQGAFTLWADSEFNTNVYTKSDGGGFIADTHAYGTGNANSVSQTAVGANAIITANSVALLASGTNMTPHVSTRSHSGGLFGSATADSNINVNSTANVLIGGGSTQITGYEGVDVRAYHQDFEPDRETDAHFSGIGEGHNRGDNNNTLTTTVAADAGATVTAGVRPPGTLSPLQQVANYNSLALYVDANNIATINDASEVSSILWNANVNAFGGQSPTLIVDANGDIVEAVGVSVNDNGTNKTSGHIDSSTIVVNPINGGGGAQVVFAGASITDTANSPYPLFSFLQTVAAVTIINQSGKDLQIQGINVAGGGAGQVVLESPFVSFLFDIQTGEVAPTSIDIENQVTGTQVPNSNIIFTDLVNNPIGSTTIKNERGNIVASSTAAIIRTNTLDIEATGSIGASTARLNVDLVESEDPTTGDLRYTSLLGTATTGDIYLNLTGRRRDDSNTPFVVYVDTITAGGTIDLLLQSSVVDPSSGGIGGGVQVTSFSVLSPSGTYFSHYHPDPANPPPNNLDRGVFANTTNSPTTAGSYQFGVRDQNNALTGSPGLVAGGNIRVIAAAPTAIDPALAISGITQLTGQSGYIDTTTNGDITWTEFGGSAMRVGAILSDNGNVVLTNPDLSTPGQDLHVYTLIRAAAVMTLRIGDNVTTDAGSILRAETSIDLLVDYLTPDPDPNVGAIVNINGGISSPVTNITGHGDNDTINLNDADAINSGRTPAVVNVNGGGGSNSLKVNDSGDPAARTGAMTFNTVTGLGMGGSGVTYVNVQALEVDLSNGGTVFTVYSTNATTPTLVRGGASADTINVGSSLAEDNGDLNSIRALLTIIGNGGNDQVFLNDHANSDGTPINPNTNTPDPAYGYNYYISPTGVINDTAPVNATPPVVPLLRTFAGIVYNASTIATENTVTFLRLDCTDRTNRITVRPSTITTIFVNGNHPLPDTWRIDGGDFLDLDLTGVNGGEFRKLHITAPGAGFWTFVGPPPTNIEYAKQVQFESIERFNHVGAIATSTGANKRSLPYVRVYDDETDKLKGQFLAYDNKFRGGVRIAVEDVTADGIPDIVVVPGAGRTALLRVFSGAPDANGNYTFPLWTEFEVFPKNFRRGAFVAVGDFNGNGVNDIIVSADAGWLPVVGVFNGETLRTTHSMIVPPAPVLGSYFLAAENKFKGGVRVAAGDLNNDNKAEIIVGRGKGGVSTVTVYNGGDFTLLPNIFTPFGPKYKLGLNVAVGDFNNDGRRDIAVGAEKGWLPEVVVYSGTTVGLPNTGPAPAPVEIARFQAYDPRYRGGVHLAAKTLDGGNPDFIEQVALWLAPGINNLQKVRKATYNSATPLQPAIVDKFFEDGYYAGGIFVG